MIGGTTVSTQALVQNRQIHCYTAAFEKKLLQIFSYGGHAIVIGHLSGQAQIEQAVLELQLENVHTIDALILLSAGGSPRVSLAALTTRFEVGTAACPSEDNLSTQAAESLARYRCPRFFRPRPELLAKRQHPPIPQRNGQRLHRGKKAVNFAGGLCYTV